MEGCIGIHFTMEEQTIVQMPWLFWRDLLLRINGKLFGSI